MGLTFETLEATRNHQSNMINTATWAQARLGKSLLFNTGNPLSLPHVSNAKMFSCLKLFSNGWKCRWLLWSDDFMGLVAFGQNYVPKVRRSIGASKLWTNGGASMASMAFGGFYIKTGLRSIIVSNKVCNYLSGEIVDLVLHNLWLHRCSMRVLDWPAFCPVPSPVDDIWHIKQRRIMIITDCQAVEILYLRRMDFFLSLSTNN